MLMVSEVPLYLHSSQYEPSVNFKPIALFAEDGFIVIKNILDYAVDISKL